MKWKTSKSGNDKIYSHCFLDNNLRPFLSAEIVVGTFRSFVTMYMNIGGWEVTSTFQTVKDAKASYKEYAENMILSLQEGLK